MIYHCSRGSHDRRGQVKVYVTFEDGGLKAVEWKRRRDVNVRFVETICYLDKIRCVVGT